MNFLQLVSEFAGLVSIVVTIVGAVLGAVLVGRSKATNTTSDAQEKAINAMQAQLEIQRLSIEDMKKENTRLQLIIETISAALKGMNLIVTIDGEMVRIRDNNNNNNSTTTRIHSVKEEGI